MIPWGHEPIAKETWNAAIDSLVEYMDRNKTEIEDMLLK